MSAYSITESHPPLFKKGYALDETLGPGSFGTWLVIMVLMEVELSKL